MAKYYISTGEFKCVLDRQNQKIAAVDAFKILNNADLGVITMVSEHGFESEADDNIYFHTINLLEESGQIENYINQDWS